ncbi:TPA: hypothetical protein N0F65_003988 [Lagenidium giganteum]|uniref:EML-like first beta-propeller domain-containing protein n=1 Tax=Lagenidium giganteum TaxID=4803 RepID=A0AAV2Z067_9STRA|nr:TPA: hypothetical protein N0F65_003988 [Lagenidium giganteum]
MASQDEGKSASEIFASLVASGQDPLLDDSTSYAGEDLVRPLRRWEVSRDHIVFSDMCGLDAAKRHIVHFLEPAREGVHGGVLLMAVGNTVQLLTLALSGPTTPGIERSNILHRQYLFGTGGSGVGCLAVHPTRRFFAVGEKGVKPNISIYRYPSPKVCRVLRNGTEFAYNSVVFSQDGDKLASVGASPDFLLTVWNWRSEQTILRCKAFGQEVFSVQFAPTDNGFLTTSGIGHIRFWKMASTFTGLKLQGDIGKFGKSELSDIEAFCVLPDKKVLSGTERGMLLLWDGNFIKCEIMTSRRHLPHNGAINVVNYEADRAMIVTAGKDGFVKFWTFDSIDRADVPPDDVVALVPIKHQFCIAPQMDIRSVVRESDTSYLVQDAVGAIHKLHIMGESHRVDMYYLPNPTGRVVGVACSPYEHLAATCGQDGHVRAWDYITRKCLFSSPLQVPPATEGESATSAPEEPPATGTCIAWVPNAAAFTTDQLVHSRQVVVGSSDGLVRVFLLDYSKRTWVRTNVFKPHHASVLSMSFSHTGRYLATSSADGTFFLFKSVPNAKTSKYSKYPPSYQPLGFQRCAAGVVALSWRDDERAVLVTLATGKVLEYGVAEDVLDPQPPAADLDDDEGDGKEAASDSYELNLPVRELSVLQRMRFMGTKELEALEGQNPVGNPILEEKIKNGFQVETRAAPAALAFQALYQTRDTFFLSAHAPLTGNLFLCQWGKQQPVHEYPSESEHAHIVTMALSTSTKYLLCGMSNGKFQVRSTARPHAFLVGEMHDYGSAAQSTMALMDAPKLHVALSFDDSFILSAGADGNLSICRLNSEKLEHGARILSDKHGRMLAEARIAADQAAEKQQAQLDVMTKASADSKDEGGGGGASSSGGANDLTSLPAFHAAKAFAAYVEAQLDGTAAGLTASIAKDEEMYLGVPRLASDLSNLTGLPQPPPMADSANTHGTMLGLHEVPDMANPKEAYTIEDAKLKSEADARANATRTKQERTREVLDEMRRQLQELRATDASYAPESRLEEDEWEIDLDYGELLAKRGDEACDEVRKELAYATEKEELLLMKMRETYVSQLAVELITLKAFESGLSVQSFRTMKMPLVLQKRLSEIHTNDTNEALKSTKRQTMVGSQASITINGGVSMYASARTVGGGSMGSVGAGAGAAPAGTGGGTKVKFLRKASVLDIMTKDKPLDEEFPLKEEERKMILQSAGASTGGATSTSLVPGAHHAGLPPGAPTALEGGATTGGSVHGFEARKRLRGDRKEKLQHWLQSKPGEDADDPRDLVAIAFAQRNMGDYKLKTAANYVVPEEQRVNAAKKRRQMALLEERIYEARLNFNAKMLELRELKLLLVQELREDEKRIQFLKQALADKQAVTLRNHRSNSARAVTPLPSTSAPLEVDLSEWPEQRERVVDADIELYMKEKKVLPHSAVVSLTPTSQQAGDSSSNSSTNAVDNQGLALAVPGTTSSYGGKRESVLLDRSIAALSRKLHSAATANGGGSGGGDSGGGSGCSTGLTVRHLCLDDMTMLAAGATRSNLDIDDASLRVYLMKQEIRKLMRKKQDEITAFDDAVAHLRGEKMKLEVIFKKCELRLFTLLSELVLLEQFESKENLLSSKLDKNKNEKAQIVAEITDIQDNLSNKKKEVEEWSKQEKAIQAEFLTLVNGNGSSGSGGATDVDDAMSEINKSMEELKKSNERQVAKQRQIDKELQATEQDIQLFQSEKQMRFNQLDVVVALSKHQVRSLTAAPSQSTQSTNTLPRFKSGSGVRWELPETATSSLVFTTRSFEALTERIESLQKENRSLRQQFRDLHKQQNVLAKEKKVQQERIGEIQDKCEQLQLLKFGQLVDIEVLDKACDTTKLHELQTKVQIKEMDAEREVRKIKQAQHALTQQILQATEHNTSLLSRIAALNERQLALERELNQANLNQSVLQDESAHLEHEMAERNKLVKLVKLQAREVEALKQEIGLLRGKDGKVYAPH